MKKLILFVLVLGGGYLTYVVLSIHMAEHASYCFAQTKLVERLKISTTTDEADKLKSDMVQCIEDRKTFVQSLFFSRKTVSDGVKINLPASH